MLTGLLRCMGALSEESQETFLILIARTEGHPDQKSACTLLIQRFVDSVKADRPVSKALWNFVHSSQVPKVEMRRMAQVVLEHYRAKRGESPKWGYVLSAQKQNNISVA